MREREHVSPPVVGGSSLLVIFAVLCLTMFALMALSTVQADRRLSDASAKAVSDYYQADCQAEAILAQLRRGEVPDGVVTDGSVYSYTCPISDTQQLQVEVQYSEGQWSVLCWKAVSTVQWEADDTLELWDGNVFF